MSNHYRKKPVVVEAFQMTEARRMDNSGWPEWLHEAWNKPEGEPGALFRQNMDAPLPDLLCIQTLEGVHLVTFGDWIIRGVAGELYPCKPDIFAATYESAALNQALATTERKGEPVTVEAVATVGDCAELRWLVEGGVTALPPGAILLVADKVITDGDGQGEVYTSPQVPEGFALVKSPITEAMHTAACKVLTRSTGLDGLPQRMLDAMIDAARKGE